jgi:undecaprenyl phosphate N,N'-diacetylbacillosamine 1-phosphate transferase
MYKIFSKRLIDFFVSVICLIIISPLFILITIFVLVFHGGNPFFIQPRPGKSDRIFRLVKFKTMNNAKDENGKLLPDKERITTLGKFMRANSLDEIPQLLNVMKGDMSLIGPRPLLIDYLSLYTIHQARRHEVRPGITGWAQVNGRNAISWEEKFDFDVWYVDNLNFCLDLKIVWMTILKVVKREGINAADATTMKPFTGSR